MNRFKFYTAILVICGSWGCASNDAFDPGNLCSSSLIGKTEPGTCGCNVADIDADNNGVMDCLEASSKPDPESTEKDQCPDDDTKISEGKCGCGVPDDDSDEDGVPNCFDLCPDDPDKLEKGICGCGTPDDDINHNGIIDCNEHCEPRCEGDVFYGCEDGLYADQVDCTLENMVCIQENGDSGCVMGKCRFNGELVDEGTKACDGDRLLTCTSGRMEPSECEQAGFVCRVNDLGEADCRDLSEDLCPDDPDKTDPGVCGCGNLDEDTNHNDIIDCQENCTPACENNQVIKCNGKLFAETIVCEAPTEVCAIDGDKGPTCVAPDPRCDYLGEMLDPGTTRCDTDGKLLTCTASQMIPSLCADAKICDNGECRDFRGCNTGKLSLAHGDGICMLNLALTCQDGTLVATKVCGLTDENEMCVYSETGADCQVVDETTSLCMDDDDRLYADGIRKCSDDNRVIEVCEEGVFVDLPDHNCSEYEHCVMESHTPKCVPNPIVLNSIAQLAEEETEGQTLSMRIIDTETCDTTISTSNVAEINVVGVVVYVASDGFYVEDASNPRYSAAIFVSMTPPSGLAAGHTVRIQADAIGTSYCRLQIMGNVTVTNETEALTLAPMSLNGIFSNFTEDVPGAIKFAVCGTLAQFTKVVATEPFSSEENPVKGWDFTEDGYKVRVGAHYITDTELQSLISVDKAYTVAGLIQYKSGKLFLAPRNAEDIIEVVCKDLANKPISHGGKACSSETVLSTCLLGDWSEPIVCEFGCDAATNACSTKCNADFVECDGNSVYTCVVGQEPVTQACTGSTPYCQVGKCVQCTQNSDCGSLEICSTTNTCVSVECLVNTDCTDPAKPACNTTSHACVECTKDADCADGTVCLLNKCSTAPLSVGCSSNSECIAKDSTKPLCDSPTHACRACKSGEACPI